MKPLELEQDAMAALSPAPCSAVASVTLEKRIRWLREQCGQTRCEFAKMLGVSLSLVSLWEDGKRNITTTRLMEMCERGGISLDFMLNSTFLPTFKIPETKPKRRKRIAAQPNAPHEPHRPGE